MSQENFSGGFSSAIAVESFGVNLPDVPAKRVKLSNWNVQPNTSLTPLNQAEFQTGYEVYYGYNGIHAHQLFPGKDSDWLNVKNLSEISLRSRPGATIKIYYSYET